MMVRYFALVACAGFLGCGGSDFAGTSGKKTVADAKAPAKDQAEGDADATPLGQAAPATGVPAAASAKADTAPTVGAESEPVDATTAVAGKIDGTTAANATIATDPSTLTPAPDTAVRKGSFKIWSVPADPAPYEDYQVVVEVALPSDATQYQRSDLTGEIKGTEGWFTWTLGSDERKPSSFETGGGVARLTTWVPGDDAVEGYGDVITVKSALLGETQSFEVSF